MNFKKAMQEIRRLEDENTELKKEIADIDTDRGFIRAENQRLKARWEKLKQKAKDAHLYALIEWMQELESKKEGKE
jgi:uncharacterized protein (DUF3084 family)